jgi:iron complex outermembrane receptor protein
MLSAGRFLPTPVAFALALALEIALAPALAQPVPAQAPEPEDPPPTVVVTATRTERDPLDVPASVDVIDREDLHDAQLRVNASETLARIPGVVATNRQNYAQDLQLSIRGFGARSSFGVRGVRLYVDGVPATLPDGQGQLSNFPLNAAQDIEVLRGPFSALYGNSSGGVIVLTTALRPKPLEAEASYAAGSYNTTRAAADLAGGAGSFAYAVDGVLFRTGGFRPHSGADRGIANLRFGFLDTPIGELRLSANSLESANAQDPMGLTRKLLNADPEQTIVQAFQFDTRKSTRQGTLGADLRSTLGPVKLETSAWIGYRGIRQFQSIPLSTQTQPIPNPNPPPPTLPNISPGGVIDLGRHFGGVDSRATLEAGIFTTTGGLDFERLVEDRFGYNNFTAPSPVPPATACGVGGVVCGVLGALRRDETNSVNMIDPYLQTEARLGERWRLLAGVRSSHLRFDSADHLANNAGSAAVSYSALNPTAGVVFRVTPEVSTYASYGRGFETPTLDELAYKPDGSPGLNTALKAARSNNYEVGAKTRQESGLTASAALFDTLTRNDIVVRTNFNGRSTYGNAAQTRRRGLELEAEADPSEEWTLAASASWIVAYFAGSFQTCTAAPCVTPNLTVAAGNHLPAVPARTVWAQAQYHAGWAEFSVEGHFHSRLFVNDLNGDEAGGAGVFSAVVEHTGSWGRLHPHVFARVDNLTNRKYVGSVIVNESNGRFFESAPTRTWLFGLDVPV